MSLPIGLTVNATIVVAENLNAVTIPRSAMRTAGTRTFVLVDESGIAAERDVRVVDWPAERLEVTAGISVGDRVILEPDKAKVGRAVAEAGG